MSGRLRDLLMWALAAVVMPAALTGCGSAPVVKPAELPEVNSAVKIKELWSSDVGAAKPYTLSPASAQGDLFVADAKGRLARVDGSKGKFKWKVDTDQPISGGVGVGGALVLVGTAKGKVLAYGLDGKPKWQAQLRSEVLAPPVANDQWVIVRSGDGIIYGLNAADGSKKWEYQTVLPSLILRSEAGVNLDGEFVFAGLPGGKVVALRTRDGVQLWEASITQPKGDNEVERVADVSGPPLRAQAQACLATFQGRVGCFDLEKGAGLWSREASTAHALAGDAQALYLVDDRSHVLAFDREDGKQLWKQDKLYGRRLSGPLIRGEHLIAADFEGYVHIMDRKDGRLLGRVRVSRDPVWTAPIALGNTIVVQSVDGDLSALSVQ